MAKEIQNTSDSILRAGDTLIISFRIGLEQEDKTYLKRELGGTFPEVKILIIDNVSQMLVYRP